MILETILNGAALYYIRVTAGQLYIAVQTAEWMDDCDIGAKHHLVRIGPVDCQSRL